MEQLLNAPKNFFKITSSNWLEYHRQSLNFINSNELISEVAPSDE